MDFLNGVKKTNINFWSKEQLTKKKDWILIKNLVSNKWKYKTKEARLILRSGVYIILPIFRKARPSFFLHVRPWRKKAVPSEILVKLYIFPDCKIGLASFVLHIKYIFFYYIDTGVLLENIPLVKFIKTTFGTWVVYFP